MRSHAFLCGLSLAAIFVTLAATATAQEAALPQTPAEYERFALEQSPALRAEYEKWQAKLEEAKAAGARWPQPRLGYTASIDAFWGDNRIGHTASISQTIPWFGALDKAAHPPHMAAQAMRRRFEDIILETVFEVRKTLVDIARIDALRELVAEQREVYREAQAIVEQVMTVGDADYSDLLRLSLAEEMLGDRIDQLDGQRARHVARMRELLDVDPDAELSFDFTGAQDLLDVPEELPEKQPLVEAVAESNPELAASLIEARATRAHGEHFQYEPQLWPTVSLGVESMPMPVDERRTALMVGFSIPLPVFGSQYDHIDRQYLREHNSIMDRRHATERRLTAEVDAAVARIAEQLRRLERYRDELLPLAGDASERVLSRIEVGETTVTDYMLAVEQELDLQSALIDFRATIATERARLERLTAGEFQAHPERRSPTLDIEDVEKGGQR